jgi:enoyl-CoA hydratase
MRAATAGGGNLMSDEVLLQQRDGAIVTLTLNRPESMNALSKELRTALVRGFDELARDDSVAAVIVTGAGRAFCAGLDLKELSRDGISGGPTPGAEYDVIRAMRRFDRPIIGAVNGVAVTGGFELALACDLLIASTAARFADTHARVGILPGWGLSQKLPRMIGVGRAKELSFTGNYLPAVQAEAWGLVNRVVAPEHLLEEALRLAQEMATCVPEALRAIKAMIDDGYESTLADGLRMESKRSTEHARSVTADQIADRRAAVQERGRKQTES